MREDSSRRPLGALAPPAPLVTSGPSGPIGSAGGEHPGEAPSVPAPPGGGSPTRGVAAASAAPLAPALFLRLLGLCAAGAFVSSWTQLDGLIGPQGILPAERFLEAAGRQLGDERFARLPTLCWWIGAGPLALHALCAVGSAASLLLASGRFQALAVAVAWVCQASLVAVGQVFLRYQWDALLLETLALAFFVAPWNGPASVGAGSGLSRLAPLLGWWGLRALLAKLMLLSGIAKLASGDPTWADLSALQFHYFTTCLPVWTGFFASWLPAPFHSLAVLVTFAVELVLPFFVFFGRRARLVAALGFALLQIGIGATGNYGFFNALALVLCASLLDERSLQWALVALRGGRPRSAGRARGGRGAAFARVLAQSRALLAVALAAVWLPVSLSHAVAMLAPESVPASAAALMRAAAPWHLANGYGLFANMTTRRPEIEVQVSSDGQHWEPLRFRWKPGPIDERPRFVWPLHMPRLDWQMWFAALRSYRSDAWFRAFLARVLAAEPAVLGLLESVPLDGQPPLAVRAVLFEYRFASPEHWWKTGEWWQRERLGPYSPVLRR